MHTLREKLSPGCVLSRPHHPHGRALWRRLCCERFGPVNSSEASVACGVPPEHVQGEHRALFEYSLESKCHLPTGVIRIIAHFL